MNVFADRRSFLKMAVGFEGGLLAAALLLDWVFGLDSLGLIRWSLNGLVWGVGAALLLFGLFLFSIWFQPRPIARIHRILDELLGPLLAACRWYDLIAVAILAGVGEEVLFRGVLQVGLGKLAGPIAGLLGASLLFGLAHALTPTYALLAGLVGAYLGVLMNVSGETNLLAPIVAHALYDYLAFLVVIRLHRSGDAGDARFDNATPDERETEL